MDSHRDLICHRLNKLLSKLFKAGKHGLKTLPKHNIGGPSFCPYGHNGAGEKWMVNIVTCKLHPWNFEKGLSEHIAECMSLILKLNLQFITRVFNNIQFHVIAVHDLCSFVFVTPVSSPNHRETHNAFDHHEVALGTGNGTRHYRLAYKTFYVVQDRVSLQDQT